MNLNEVSPPGWGHTKAEKEKTKPWKPKSKIGGTAAAFKRALDDGRFKGLPGSKTKKEKTADMFKLMWSMKKKGDNPHYKPGTDKKYKKYQEVDEARTIRSKEDAEKARQQRDNPDEWVVRNKGGGHHGLNRKSALKGQAQRRSGNLPSIKQKELEDHGKRNLHPDYKKTARKAISIERGRKKEQRADAQSKSKETGKQHDVDHIQGQSNRKKHSDRWHKIHPGDASDNRRVISQADNLKKNSKDTGGKKITRSSAIKRALERARELRKEEVSRRSKPSAIAKKKKLEKLLIDKEVNKIQKEGTSMPYVSTDDKKAINKRAKNLFKTDLKGSHDSVNEASGGGVPLSPQELEIQKKMARLNVRLARKRSQALSQAKTKDTETAPEQVKEGSLRKWFKGSKSKDGKGGWVNVVTGGTCASDEPGEGTPKCVSSAKRASMTKAERLSASRRKKAADPGQQQKTGAAKPTYVRTDSKKKMKEETAMQDNNLYGDAYAGLKRKIGSKKKHDKPAIEEGIMKMVKRAVKKKEERKPKKAMDAGARAKRMLARRVHAHYVSGSEDNVPDDIREPDKVKEAKEVKLETKKNCGCGQDPCVTYGNKELTQVQKVDEACWKGYKAYGMKKKGGKMVPNCKPVGSVKEAKIDDVKYSKDEKRKNYETDVHTLSSNKGVRSDRNKRRSATDVVFHGHSKVERDRKQAHYKSRGVKKVKGVKEEVVAEADKKGKGSGTKDACYHKVKASAKVWPSAYASGRLVQCRKKGAANYGKSKSEGFEGWLDNTILEKTAAWTRKEGKNKEGGLNEKGRKSYEKANPGSDLKAPQPEGGSRKKSFCARMGGMKKKLTSAKTANDPDSRINKALRKWKC